MPCNSVLSVSELFDFHAGTCASHSLVADGHKYLHVIGWQIERENERFDRCWWPMNIYNTWTDLIVYYQHHHQHFCVPHIIMQHECNQLKYSVNAIRYEWESDVRGHSFTRCVNYSYRRPLPTRVASCQQQRADNKSTATGDVIMYIPEINPN